MPRNRWSLITIVVKAIMRADIRSITISAAISAMPRSSFLCISCSVLTVDFVTGDLLFVAIDEREVADAHDRGQMVAHEVVQAQRLRFLPGSDVHRDLANLVR